MTDRVLRIGTRGSALARWQAEWVRKQLARFGIQSELVIITTSGDRHQHWAVESLGATGVFTREIQLALLANEVDLAVHSLKDLPTISPEGLIVAAIPPRGPVGDLLISRRETSLVSLPPGATIGTGSRRRAAQILYHRPDLKILPLRGNVDTRLRKLEEGQFDAIIVAEAGLKRLGRHVNFAENLTPQWLLPAPGQGALAVETRRDDWQTRQSVQSLHDKETAAAVAAERSFLAALAAGCLAPVAAWAHVLQNRLVLTGRVLSPDGSRKLEATCAGEISQPEKLGHQLAELLHAQGAGEIIISARS